MSVIQDNSITTNSVKPADGQSLVLKKAGGTASITVATSGEATFAENIILTANKGLSFQNHSVSSATGASSTTSDNVLDDYEEGTFNPTTSGITIGDKNTLAYTKIGRVVFIQGRITFGGSTAGSGEFYINNFPFALGSNTTMAEYSYYPTFNVQVTAAGTAFSGTVSTFMTTGSTSARFRDAGGVTGTSSNLAVHIDNGSNLYISGYYFVD